MNLNYFILHQKENRALFLLSLIAVVIQFMIFKYLYPYPNFIQPDSNSYIEAAVDNKFINLWPIGYSKFLRLINCFTSSHLVLVLFQYLLLQSSIIYLLFTIKYFTLPSKWFFILLLGLSIFNPALIHISNFISSDSLFLALSVTWLSQLIWIKFNPNIYLLLSHSIIVLLTFTVRYNALYYPILTILIIMIATRLSLKIKLASVSITFILLLIFVLSIKYEYKLRTKTSQFAPFSGWQLASNALYGYSHAKHISLNNVPNQFKSLHFIVNHHIDSLSHLVIRPDNEPGIYYLWNNNAPLKTFMELHFKNDDTTDILMRWAIMSPLYFKYGLYLIKQDPISFFQYYLWPNSKKYYSPPVGFMGFYNMGQSVITPLEKDWFGLKTGEVHTRAGFEIKIMKYAASIIATLNIAFILSYIAFIIFFNTTTPSNHNYKLIQLFASIWLSNFMFSIFSAPIEMRYQLFPFCITLIAEFLIIYITLKSENYIKHKSSRKTQISAH